MKDGVDAGAGDRRRGLGAQPPGGARECPYKAAVRIVSGSVVPGGSGQAGRSGGLTSRTCASWRDPLAGCACRGRLDRDRTHVCSFVAPSQTNASPGDRYLPLFPQPARAPARLGLRCRSQVGQLPDCATGLSGWTPDRLGGTTTFRQPTPAGPVGVGVPGGGARGHHPRRIRRRGSIRRRCG